VRRRFILLGLLAAFVSACDRGAPPPTGTALPDSADQVLWGVTTNMTIDGVLRIRLQSDTVYNYQTSQVADLVGVKVEFFTQDGRVSSTVTSREGTFEYRTENMEARGDVVAVTPDRKRLTTDTLRYNRAAQMISGPGRFVFDGPGGEHLEGVGFTADPEFSRVQAGAPSQGRPGAGEIGR
jgi:LPS export ABC transporter protein LptC